MWPITGTRGDNGRHQEEGKQKKDNKGREGREYKAHLILGHAMYNARTYIKYSNRYESINIRPLCMTSRVYSYECC